MPFTSNSSLQMSFEGSGSSSRELHNAGLHSGPHWSEGNSSATCLQESYSDFDPPFDVCKYDIRSPHVKSPAASVTGVFQTVSVQAEHPQYDVTWDGVGFDVGEFEGANVVGRLVGNGIGWSLGEEVGRVEGDLEGAKVGFIVGRSVGGLLGLADGEELDS